ncbi:hypothetical protein QBC39DRAFT_355852 [Podospora conica]|nr:hypothetical protein QBC39DRAFT_355852 [Schizothecium conicum]
MTLKKQNPTQDPDFDQDRLDRLFNSLQPLLTRNLTDKEVEVLFQETDSILRRKTWLTSWLNKTFGKRKT